MNDLPLLVLNGTFTFQKRTSFYTVTFLRDLLVIQDDILSKTIKFTEIYKIKYSLTTLKVFLKSNEKIKLPCNSTDLKKIKTHFKITDDSDISSINASAAVSIEGNTFFILINSTNLKELKSRIIKRIAKYIYPACEVEEIYLDMFNNFKFIVLSEGFEVELSSSQDLAAALAYNGNRLRITIKTY